MWMPYFDYLPGSYWQCAVEGVTTHSFRIQKSVEHCRMLLYSMLLRMKNLLSIVHEHDIRSVQPGSFKCRHSLNHCSDVKVSKKILYQYFCEK